MISLHQVKQGVARSVGRFVDLDRRIEARRGRYVICYHRVISREQAVDEWVHHSMWISPQTFDAQIRWMLSVGEIVPQERVLDFDAPNERPLFALTFDDGWRDNYENAWPIMKRHGVTATIFLATSFMDDGRLIWPEDLTLKTRRAMDQHAEEHVRAQIRKLAPKPSALHPTAGARASIEMVIEQLKYVTESERLARIAAYCEALGIDTEPLKGHMMTWSEASQMYAAGIRMGSHTHTHRICSQSTSEQIEEELRVSRERIRSMLGCEVETFAYPNARYHGWEGPVLQQAGYRSAFRIHNLPLTPAADSFFLPRMISAESVSGPEFFKLRLLGVY
jgi:peptidoglycan/xylan/chitin deacetylase (PgdA/CDA1 family)